MAARVSLVAWKWFFAASFGIQGPPTQPTGASKRRSVRGRRVARTGRNEGSRSGRAMGRKGDEQSLLVAFYPEFGRNSPRDAPCFVLVHTREAATKQTTKKKRGVSEKCCAPRDENTLSAIPTSGRSRIFRPEHLCNLFFVSFLLLLLLLLHERSSDNYVTPRKCDIILLSIRFDNSFLKNRIWVLFDKIVSFVIYIYIYDYIKIHEVFSRELSAYSNFSKVTKLNFCRITFCLIIYTIGRAKKKK